MKVAAKAPAKKAKAPSVRVKRTCPVPGCLNPTKGPRFRFFCATHRDMPKAKQDAILAAAKGDQGSKVAATTGGNGATAATASVPKKAKRKKPRTRKKPASGKKATAKKTD